MYGSKLFAINLSRNNLSGQIPAFGPTPDIVSLNLVGNMLTGPIPASISSARALTSLRVGDNRLDGTLPDALFGLPLQELHLNANFFGGSISNAISQASSLESLRLGPNSFEGPIPTSIDFLTNLKELSIERIWGLTGRLPESFSLKLTKLERFILKETGVIGNIPASIGNMKNLEWLDLAYNKLHGDLPWELGSLTKLRKFVRW